MAKKEGILDGLRHSLVKLDIEGVQKACKNALEAGIPAYKAVIEGMTKGMEIVGQKFQTGEYFLAELIMAGETMKQGMKILEPHLRSGDVKVAGTVVMGTVKGDLHDIGKNIVITLLKAAGFELIDLGVDVPAEKFVEAVNENEPDILAMSALLTVTMAEMETVIKEIEKAGLRDKVKVIIGGAPITSEYATKIGADAAAKDAFEGVNFCKVWMGVSSTQKRAK